MIGCSTVSSRSSPDIGDSVFRVLPKSARWLMANDKKEEAWTLIQKAAQMNEKPLPKDLQMCQVLLKSAEV